MRPSGALQVLRNPALGSRFRGNDARVEALVEARHEELADGPRSGAGDLNAALGSRLRGNDA